MGAGGEGGRHICSDSTGHLPGNLAARTRVLASMAGDGAVGLRLGNTNGAVAICRDGSAEVVANDLGHRTTPAVVAYLEEETLVGMPAKNDSIRHPKQTLVCAHGALAKQIDDESIAHLLPALKRCGAAAGKKGSLVFNIPEKEKPISPEDPITHVLRHLRDTAQAQVGGEVKRIVLAIPSQFTAEQQDSLRHAAGDAGLQIARYIPEPVAAALAYGIGQEDPSVDHNVAVVHVGGTESCVTVLSIRDGTFREVCSELDTGLSGAGFDTAICDVLARDFKRKAKIDISDMVRPKLKLAAAAADAKAVLSTKETASVSIDGLAEGMDLNVNVARSRFDAMNSKLFTRATELVSKAVASAGLTLDGVTDVVLSGGASNIVGLQKAIRALFGREILHQTIPGEEVIAVGAALQAALMGDPKDDKLNAQVTEVDALAADVCLKAVDGSLVTVATAGIPYPLRRAVSVSPSEGQDSISLVVVERTADGSEPKPLAELNLKGIAAGADGKRLVEFVFEVNKGGTAKVSARDEHSSAACAAHLEESK